MEAEDSEKSNEDWLNSRSARGFGRVFAKIFGDGAEESEKPAAATVSTTEYPGSLRNMLRDDDYDDEDDDEEDDAKLSSAATMTHHTRTGEYDDRTAAEAAAMSTFKPRSDPVMLNTVAKKQEEIELLAETLLGFRGKSHASPPAAAAATEPDDRKKRAPSPKSPKRRKTTTNTAAAATVASNKLIPLSEFLQQSKTQISTAGALVARTLQSGPWPSPYRSLHPQDIASPGRDSRAHAMHVSMVGASLEKFTNDIIAQTIVQELHYTPRSVRPQVQQRTFLGTLVLLREALILNAATIFGDSALLTGKESDFGTSLEELQKEDDSHAVALFSVKVLATTVVLTALEELEDTERFSDEFLRLVEQYDLGDREFVSCLRPVTSNDLPVFPNRQKMLDHERRSWRVSYNSQLEQHPLVKKDPSVVQSTAVHVSILQQSEETNGGVKTQ